MHRSAAVLCEDATSLQTLRTVLGQLGIDPVTCRSQQEAMEQILAKRCAALVVDFDLPGAAEIAKLPALLDPQQKPVLLAMTAPWPGSGQAFQSGANRILYKPLQATQVRDAFETTRQTGKRDGRNTPRYKITSVVWLELEGGTLPAVAINVSEHGMAIRTTQRLRVQFNVSFRCTLPGTSDQLHGHADVIWADAAGRAGMLFSRLAPAVQKHLKGWLRKRGNTGQGKNGRAGSGAVRSLLQPADSDV